MKKINNFFFPLEEGEKLHPSDAIFFYGTLISILTIGIVVII